MLNNNFLGFSFFQSITCTFTYSCCATRLHKGLIYLINKSTIFNFIFLLSREGGDRENNLLNYRKSIDKIVCWKKVPSKVAKIALYHDLYCIKFSCTLFQFVDNITYKFGHSLLGNNSTNFQIHSVIQFEKSA